MKNLILLLLIPPPISNVNDVKNDFDFNIDSNLDNAFKFNENNNVEDMGFTNVKTKRKLKNVNVSANFNDNELGLKIAKHAVFSRRIPTQNKSTNLKDTALIANDTQSPSNKNTNIIKQSQITYP